MTRTEAAVEKIKQQFPWTREHADAELFDAYERWHLLEVNARWSPELFAWLLTDKAKVRHPIP